MRCCIRQQSSPLIHLSQSASPYHPSCPDLCRPVNNSRERYSFSFDGILTPEAKQDEVIDPEHQGGTDVTSCHPFPFIKAPLTHPRLPPSHTQVFERVAHPVVVSTLEGYNGTVFAYGQTGSGKTFTITGGAERYVDRGVIPRTISSIFKELSTRSNYTYQVMLLLMLLLTNLSVQRVHSAVGLAGQACRSNASRLWVPASSAADRAGSLLSDWEGAPCDVHQLVCPAGVHLLLGDLQRGGL